MFAAVHVDFLGSGTVMFGMLGALGSLTVLIRYFGLAKGGCP